ncbi:MAG TPA: alpha/beta fold hydrolase [Ilumatobacteraceae bacterium]
MRAAYPDREGTVERNGANVAFEVYERPGAPTLLLTQTWQIIHSRHWKFMIPYLSRHYRVVTYDPVGNGRSDRSFVSERYARHEQLDDALAVLDATGTATAIAIGLSLGGGLATLLGALHPERIDGVVAIAPSHRWVVPDSDREAGFSGMFDPVENPQGWEKYNVHYWRENWADFVEFFFAECCSDPHSTKLWDDTTGWAMETDGELIALGEEAAPIDVPDIEAVLLAMRMPMLIIHGTGDRIVSYKSSLELQRRIPHAQLMTMDGVGHLPTGRYPVRINHAIKAFADQTYGRTGTAAGPSPSPSPSPSVSPLPIRPRRRRARALMISSPIGLGHARRDVAICQELRRLRPELEIEWLAQDPVTRVLASAGEPIHPASALLANESAHLESECGEHDLAVFQTLRDMDEILVANFMICDEVIEAGQYDLVIGDESWELDHHLHENPHLKKTAYAWMTDFVGYLPMPERGEREAFVAADYNAEMIGQIERLGEIRDKAIFVGNPEDIVPDRFGPGLPAIREWTEAHYDFAGYVTGFDPAELGDREELRAELGYHPDERICIVSVGGSGVGADLLRRVVEAAPAARRAVDGLRFVVVTGPRIDPATMPAVDGVEYRPYVDRLYRHLAGADLAVVQGGLSTTMELAACRVPFVYVPLRNHFEQNFHVRARLDRYNAGRHLDYADADPDHVAAVIAEEIGRSPTVRAVETDGAAKAAAIIAELV